MKTIGFIGAGRMAQALANGFVKRGMLAAEQIRFSDPSNEAAENFGRQLPGAQRRSSGGELLSDCDVIWLAVKPQSLAMVFAELQQANVPDLQPCLFVSVVAGATCQRLSEGLQTARVIRVMPNTPSLIGQGVAAYSPAESVSSEDLEFVCQSLQCVGAAVQLNESLLDAVTGLSGSGPAFVFEFIEALAAGGVAGGLPADVAQSMAARTVRGAAAMILELHQHPAALKDQVTSPGGTTIAGLRALRQAGMSAGVMDAVIAATKRSQELGEL